MSESGNSINSVLSEVFGFRSFRPHQREIIEAIMVSRDVFAVMPTGGGKSLCFQIPARLKKGVCIVISPLISLMKDQVDAANSNGLTAASLNSANTFEQKLNIERGLERGDIELLYISPERLKLDLDFFKRLPISFFAIDEAHCISEWGHEFRKDYLDLSRITEEFPKTPIAAFTATATPRVAEDIMKRLNLREPHITRASFNRSNLFYQVLPKERESQQLLKFLKERPNDSGIIYRSSRRKAEETADFLVSQGFKAKAYHAGMSDRDRSLAQEAFRRDEAPIIVATIAFGMGIDKSNVRFVVHADIPKSIEGYYQETGRAGRDGESAHCLLLYGRGDMMVHRRFAEEIEDPIAKNTALEQLRYMESFVVHDGCRRAALLRYFGENFPSSNCNGCDICSGDVERVDATIPAQKALSAMHRTRGRFGAMHIIDILIGANTDKVRQYRHNELPTFGVGADETKSFWKRVIDAIQAQGLAVVSSDPKFPTLSVSEEGWKVLRSQKEFKMIRIAKAKKERISALKSNKDEPYNTILFERLRKLRGRIASEENIPPYIVFSDKTLHEMARSFPIDRDEMLDTSGVGHRKMESYGEAFLEEIRAFVAEFPEERQNYRSVNSVRSRPVATVRTDDFTSPLAAMLTRTEGGTYNLFKAGKTIEEIAELRGLAGSTIIGHLESLILAGADFPPERFFTPEKFVQIVNLFRSTGGNMLTPVVEASNGTVNYEEAKFARAFIERKKNDE